MLDGVPRRLGQPLTASMASANRRATMTGRSAPCLASTAIACGSYDARLMLGWCSAEQRAPQLAQHAWELMEGQRMKRREAERGADGLCRKYGRVSDGCFGCDALACTLVAGAQRASLPDTGNLVEVWAGASRHCS